LTNSDAIAFSYLFCLAQRYTLGSPFRSNQAEWMRRSDLDGGLAAYFNPSHTPPERAVVQVEGWILGVA
jgi:hypothetical protein